MAHFDKYKAPALGNMTGHYERRAELEHGYRRDNIDPARTGLNYNLGPSRPGVSQVEFINARIAGLHLKRLRKDAVRMADCVVTMPRLEAVQGREREFFEAVYHTLEPMFGAENVVSAWVHTDEAQQHMHFAFVPVTGDGRLSCKDVLNRTFMKGFHAALEKGVAHRMGLERAGLTLTDEERQERGGKYVGLEEYKDAKDAAREAVAVADKAEAGRDQAAERLREVSSALEGTTMTLGQREAELARVTQETSDKRELSVALDAEIEAKQARLERLQAAEAEEVAEIGRIDSAIRVVVEKARALLEAVRAAGAVVMEVMGLPVPHEGERAVREAEIERDGHPERWGYDQSAGCSYDLGVTHDLSWEMDEWQR